MEKKINKINSYLDKLFPNPKCELNYNSDYELLIAIVLSAQSTDRRVNKVTKVLFDKYDLNGLKEAKISDLENIIRSVGTYTVKSKYIKKYPQN
jgi:endonuclease-3